MHVLSWVGDTTAQMTESSHSKNVNWLQHGITSPQLRNHHVIAILEANETGGESLTDLLQKSKLTEDNEDFGPGRVRVKIPEELPAPEYQDDRSESSRRPSDFDTPSASEELAMFLTTETSLSRTLTHRLRYQTTNVELLSDDENDPEDIWFPDARQSRQIRVPC